MSYLGKMVNFTYYKSKLTKWVVTLSLFFSIFAFSGNGHNSNSFSRSKIQTELVCSNNYKATKRNTSYRKALAVSYVNEYLFTTHKYKAQALLLYNILAKIKFDNISKKFHSIQIAKKFILKKTIPQDSNEDFSFL
jgi:hypothetical protein